MNRRGFLGTILAACAAPAIVRADSLMKIARPSERLILPGDAGFLGAVREITAYDITRDTFMTRWDVAGRVNGEPVQIHVAMESYPVQAFVSGADDPQPMMQRRTSACEPNREAGVESLRRFAREKGLLVQRGVLKIPEGMHSARFLA